MARETAVKKGVDTPAGSGRAKRLVVMITLVAVLGGAGYYFLLRPAPEKAAPEPGEVVVLDPIQVNLAEGRYLRIGVALQATLDVEEEVDGSRALDATIDVFSGVPLEDVSSPKSRERLKAELEERILELYEGDVMDMYFTEFVTQ